MQFWQLHHSWELNLLCWVSGPRSSRPDVFYNKGVLRNFAKFTGPRPATLLKKRLLWHRCFPVNFAKFLRTTFLQNTSSVCFCSSSWLLPSLSSIFSKAIFQISPWKYLFCVQQKVFGVFIFPYFVLSWYILVQGMELFKTWSKCTQNGYIFFFFYLQVAYNCSNQSKQQDEHWNFSKTCIFTNKAPLAFIFFQGLHITCKTYKRKLPIRLIYFTNVVEVIVFRANQDFSI